MFHLHPGIHFHEVDFVVRQQEFHGAGVLVADRLGGAHCQIADIGALLGRQLRTGGDLDQFLVSTLDRAVPLEQVHGVAETVSQHLGFDVLGIDDALFQEHVGAAEGLGRFGNHPRPGLLQFFLAVATANAATTATGGRLEHHRITDPVRLAQRFLQILEITLGARGHRHAGGDHAAPGFGLVAHACDHLGGGADELDPTLAADACQVGVFRQEAVTGVQRIAAGLDRQVDQLARIQVTGQRIAADVIRLIGAFDMQRIAVRIRMDGHRANAHFRAGADNADSDFATVGNQDFLDHSPFLCWVIGSSANIQPQHE